VRVSVFRIIFELPKIENTNMKVAISVNKLMIIVPMTTGIFQPLSGTTTVNSINKKAAPIIMNKILIKKLLIAVQAIVVSPFSLVMLSIEFSGSVYCAVVLCVMRSWAFTWLQVSSGVSWCINVFGPSSDSAIRSSLVDEK